MQAWEDAGLGDSCRGVEAPQQAGEPDETQNPDSLIHLGRHRILQALGAALIQYDEHDLHRTCPYNYARQYIDPDWKFKPIVAQELALMYEANMRCAWQP